MRKHERSLRVSFVAEETSAGSATEGARTFSFFSPLPFLPFSPFAGPCAPACGADLFAAVVDFFLATLALWASLYASLRRFASRCSASRSNPRGLWEMIAARSAS